MFHSALGLAITGQSLYGAAEFGDIAVNRVSGPLPSRWAVILLATAALALAGCGRKGDTGDERSAAKGTVFDPSYGANELPKTPKGNKRSFILDPLLNSN
jgi:hypothetical protein